MSTFQISDKVFHASRKNQNNEYVQGTIMGYQRRQYLVMFADRKDAELYSVNDLWVKTQIEDEENSTEAAAIDSVDGSKHVDDATEDDLVDDVHDGNEPSINKVEDGVGDVHDEEDLEKNEKNNAVASEDSSSDEAANNIAVVDSSSDEAANNIAVEDSSNDEAAKHTSNDVEDSSNDEAANNIAVEATKKDVVDLVDDDEATKKDVVDLIDDDEATKKKVADLVDDENNTSNKNAASVETTKPTNNPAEHAENAIADVKAIDTIMRLEVVKFMGLDAFSEKSFTTFADGTFCLPIESPETMFFQATKAKFFTGVQHPKVKLSVLSGDVLFADDNIVKAFTGVLCSPNGKTTIAVISTFEFIRSATSTKVNPIKLEYMSLPTLLDIMSNLEDVNGEQKRQEVSSYLLEQIGAHTTQFLDDLDDSELILMFSANVPNDNLVNLVKSGQDKGKGSKGGKKIKKRISDVDVSNVLQSSRTKFKRISDTTSAISSLQRPIPAAPWEPASAAVTVAASASSAVKVTSANSGGCKRKSISKPAANKKGKNKTTFAYDFSAGTDYSSNFEQQDYSNYSSYDTNRTWTTSGSSYTVPDKQIKPTVGPGSLDKIIDSVATAVQGIHGFIDSQKSNSTSEYEKVRLEKESALADLAKTTALNASIASHAMQIRLNDEMLQDQRHRTQTEFNLRIMKETRQIQIDLDNQENMNKFKVADLAATNEIERQLKMRNFETNSQVKLMETASTCNRNQAIFNHYGTRDAGEETEEDNE